MEDIHPIKVAALYRFVAFDAPEKLIAFMGSAVGGGSQWMIHMLGSPPDRGFGRRRHWQLDRRGPFQAERRRADADRRALFRPLRADA